MGFQSGLVRAARTAPIERMLDERRASRRLAAIAQACAIADALAPHGVGLRVGGSLARGRFGVHSDLDLLIDCAHEAEHLVMDSIALYSGPVPVDAVFLRRLDALRRDEMLEGSCDARSLRAG
jgi:predicted nucleotidyltransferase